MIKKDTGVYTVIAFFDEKGAADVVSRFSCPEKAKKRVIATQVAGGRSEVLGEGLDHCAAMVVTRNFKRDLKERVAAGEAEALPQLKYRIKTRFIDTEEGQYQIRTAKVRHLR